MDTYIYCIYEKEREDKRYMEHCQMDKRGKMRRELSEEKDGRELMEKKNTAFHDISIITAFCVFVRNER